MSDALSGSPAGPPLQPVARPPRWPGRIPRRRRGEFFLGVAGSIAMLVSVFVAAGFAPGVFPSSPITFSQQLVSCPLHETGSAVNQDLPAWAAVSVHWVVQSPAQAIVVYAVDRAGFGVLFQEGSNGTGSFQSEGGTYAFSALLGYVPGANATCHTVDLSVTVAYALV
jgi:hypothetical protein